MNPAADLRRGRAMSADAIREWRFDLGWSQPEAARQLGMAMRTIRRYELGEWPVPRYIQLACWALIKAPGQLSLDPPIATSSKPGQSNKSSKIAV